MKKVARSSESSSRSRPEKGGLEDMSWLARAIAAVLPISQLMEELVLMLWILLCVQLLLMFPLLERTKKAEEKRTERNSTIVPPALLESLTT